MSKSAIVNVHPWPGLGRTCMLDTPEARVRLAATTTMASSLAHEVSQPLTAATNYMHACARRLRDRGEGYEELVAMIDHASRETIKAGEIIRRMRSFIVSGKIVGSRENLRKMVERAVSGLTPPDGPEVEIVRNVPFALHVLADRIHIEQVFANLLRNACQAMQHRTGQRIMIGAAEADGEIVLWVEDNGPGLSAEVRAHLFEPLFTTKADGLGLGLAICKTIVEAQGGRIWAEDAAGGGALFSVALPVA